MSRPLVLLAVVGALVAATAASGADAPNRDVGMPGKLFDPAHITVLTGTSVTWRNGDSINHTVTADGDAFDSGYVAPGGSFTTTFAREGHYAYHCQIHKFMKGTVDVYSLVLTGPEKPVGFGRQVVVAGLAPAGTPSVTLLRVGDGGAGKTVKARPDGSFTVLFRAVQPGAFRAVAGKGRSPLVHVAVVPEVTAARAGSRIRVATAPARPGARVALQAYARDYFTWRTVARTRLDGNSRATVAIPAGRPGRFRVVVRGTEGWADAASAAIVVGR